MKMVQSTMKVQIGELAHNQMYALGDLVINRCEEIALDEVQKFSGAGHSYAEFVATSPRDFAHAWQQICDELNLPRQSTHVMYESLYRLAKQMYLYVWDEMCPALAGYSE